MMKKLVFLNLMLLLPLFLMAQGSVVTGTIVDNNGEPLIGVSVVEKGTSNGTVTDLDGQFSLALQAENVKKAKLVFSYVGFITQELPANSDELVKVEMTAYNQLLDEVVVVGYGSKRKGGIAAAVTTIKAEDIVRSTSTTTAGALVGKVAGITYRQNDGTPGAAASLQVRNLGTPLYVIDGIIKDETAFNNLASTDIDNISVL